MPFSRETPRERRDRIEASGESCAPNPILNDDTVTEGQDAPEIDCPLCGETVKQVASATLSLALWQHVNWTCCKAGGQGHAATPAGTVRLAQDNLTAVGHAMADQLRSLAQSQPKMFAPHIPPALLKLADQWQAACAALFDTEVTTAPPAALDRETLEELDLLRENLNRALLRSDRPFSYTMGPAEASAVLALLRPAPVSKEP